MPPIRLAPLLAALALAFPALAQQPPAPEAVPEAAQDPVEIAKALILTDRLDEARALLEQLIVANPGETEVLFLLGEVAMRQERFEHAAAYYREILIDQPNLARVRLELARALFALGADAAAARQFRLVLADPELPAPVVANVERFLDLIRERRGWDASFSFAIIPDSNINTRPEEAYFRGLRLADRPERGIGVHVGAAGEVVTPLGGDWSLLAEGAVRHTDYAQIQYDDTRLSAEVGPRLTFDNGEATLQLTGERRWFAGDEYSYSVGLELEGEYQLRPRLRLTGLASAENVLHDTAVALDGPRYGLSGAATYALTPASFARGTVGWSRLQAERDFNSNTAWRLAAGYGREFGGGYTAFVQPEVNFIEHDAPDFFFGVKREDVRLGVTATLLKRDFTFFGFAPQLVYNFTRNNSNIDTFDYNRHQGNVVLTREF